MSVEKMNTKIIQPPKEEIVKPQKMGLLVENPVYKPFRYPWCYDAWLTQQRIHWLPEEVPLGDDVRDWQKNLTQSEKNRLSRDIRKKFEVIEKLSRFEDEFKLKKGGKIKRLIEKVKKEILNSEWKNKVKEIWLFGSSVTGERSVRSDIDIVVLFKKDLDNKETTRFRLRISREFSKQIDIQVFNNLPEKIQKSILKNHKVLWKSG